MSAKYNSLQELRTKKGMVKKEIQEMEDLLTFKNKKESLSALTNGFTDRFLVEQRNATGDAELKVNKEAIVKNVSTALKTKFMNRSSLMGYADTAVKTGAAADVMRLGAVALVTTFAKKSMRSSGWKNKVIGMLLIYLLPPALRFLRQELDKYQKNSSINSMEKLI